MAAVGLILAGVVGVPHRSTGAVLCKKKSGAIVARDTACNKKEAAVNLADFGAAGPTGPTGPEGPSTARSGALTGPVTITTAFTPGDPVGHLDLPAGKYAIFAKAWLENQSAATATTASCTLMAGTDSDIVTLKLETTGTNAFRGTVALEVTHEFTSAGAAQLLCATGSGVTIHANDAAITAIEVGTVSSGPLTPG
jgi:hypothetical protein